MFVLAHLVTASESSVAACLPPAAPCCRKLLLKIMPSPSMSTRM